MTNRELIAYTKNKRLNGESDSAIARSIGMSLTHFMGLLNRAEKELETDIYKEEPKKKPEVSKKKERPVSGFGDSEAVKAAFQRAEKEKSKKNKVKTPIEESPIIEEPKEETKIEEDLSWMED